MASPSRRRRSHRHNHSDSSNRSRLLWVVLIAVFIVYSVFLAVKLLRNRFAKSTSESVPVEKITEEDATVAKAAKEDAEEITSLIKGWNRIPSIILEAQSLQDRGLLDKAEACLQKGLESCPDAARLQIKLARILTEQHKFQDAQEMLIKVLEDNPDDSAARLLLGSVYAARTNYPAVLAVANWILETNPSSVKAHKLAAEAYLNTDRPGLAIPHLRRVMATDHNDLLAQNKLGSTYALIGENVKAIQIFNDALNKDATDQMTYFNLATCYAKQDMAEQSVEVLSRASGLFGNDFVETWLSDEDFENIRDEPIFTAFAKGLIHAETKKKKGD